MKMVKSLLLGTAAGLVAVAGAQAADMPVKAAAAPVQFVKICSLYGDGYYYVPGTATCIKLGGYLRFQTEIHSGSSGIACPKEMVAVLTMPPHSSHSGSVSSVLNAARMGSRSNRRSHSRQAA